MLDCRYGDAPVAYAKEKIELLEGPTWPTDKENDDAPAHLDDCSAAGALWQPAHLAAQQELGILPEWRDQPNRTNLVDLVSDGTAVVELGAAGELAVTFCVFRVFDNLVMDEIVNEVIARLSL